MIQPPSTAVANIINKKQQNLPVVALLLDTAEGEVRSFTMTAGRFAGDLSLRWLSRTSASDLTWSRSEEDVSRFPRPDQPRQYLQLSMISLLNLWMSFPKKALWSIGRRAMSECPKADAG